MNTTYLVLGVWIIFGLKTRIWGPQFLWAILTTVFIFAVLLAVVVLIGVLFESAALATMITGRADDHQSDPGADIHHDAAAQFRNGPRTIWRGTYQVLPKVYDVGRLTLDLVARNRFEGWAPVYSSALFGAAVLGAAVYFFSRRDF